MELFLETLAQILREQISSTKELISVSLKNTPRLYNDENICGTLDKYLNKSSQSDRTIETVGPENTGSYPQRIKKFVSTNKGWIYFILLWIMFIVAIVLTVSFWWKITVFVVAIVLFIMTIIVSGKRGINIYSLKLLLYFDLMRVPGLDEKCSNVKFFKPKNVSDAKDKTFEESFDKIFVETLKNCFKITNYKRIMEFSKRAETQDGDFDSYSYLKHYKKGMCNQVPAWLILGSLILMIIIVLFVDVFCKNEIIGLISFISLILTHVIFMFTYIWPTDEDEKATLADKVNCLKYICRFHRLIQQENLAFVLLLDQSAVASEKLNIFKKVSKWELENYVVLLTSNDETTRDTGCNYNFDLKYIEDVFPTNNSISDKQSKEDETILMKWLKATVTVLENVKLGDIIPASVLPHIKFLQKFMENMKTHENKFKAEALCHLVYQPPLKCLRDKNYSVIRRINDLKFKGELGIITDDCVDGFINFDMFLEERMPYRNLQKPHVSLNTFEHRAALSMQGGSEIVLSGFTKISIQSRLH